MKGKPEPYTFKQAEDLVRDAVTRAEARHERWRVLQAIYRTGSLNQTSKVTAGKLEEFFPDLHDHVVNLVLPHLNVILASVVARDPKPLATPYGGGEVAERNRDTAQGVIGYWWSRLKATRELKDATQDAVHLGSGILKTGWRRVEEELESEDWEVREEALLLQEEDRRLKLLEGDDEPEPLSLDEAVEMATHSSIQLLENGPYIEYVSPFDFFVPPACRRLEDARWMAHRVSIPVDEVVANPTFNVSEDDVLSDGTTVAEDRFQAEARREAARERHEGTLSLETATLWEFYDMRTRRLTVFQLGAKEPLWEGEFYYDHRHAPFVHVRNYRQHGNDFWGFGDLENIAAAQGIYNELLTEAVENARRAGNKYLSRKGALDDTARAALESPEADIVAEVNTPNGEPLQDVIVPVMRAALSGDVYEVKAEMEDGIRKVLGINDFQAGGVGADRMSATAAAVVDGVATLRAQDKIASVEEAASDVAQRLLLLCQEFMDEPTAVRIAGVEGAEWKRVTTEDLYGEFQMSVESGSTKAVNPATREQQGLRTLAEVLPVVVEYGYDPTPALRSGLRDLGYDPDIILSRPQPQPGAGGMPAGGEDEFMRLLQEADMGQRQPSNGEQMMAAGGPPMPAEAQMGGEMVL